MDGRKIKKYESVDRERLQYKSEEKEGENKGTKRKGIVRKKAKVKTF